MDKKIRSISISYGIDEKLILDNSIWFYNDYNSLGYNQRLYGYIDSY